MDILESRPLEHEERGAVEDRVFDQLRTITAKVDRERPDPVALEGLRGLLQDFPKLSLILCYMHETNVRQVIVSTIQGRTGQEALLSRARHMRNDLGYQDASTLEKPLIEHLVLCWVRLQSVEIKYTTELRGSISLKQAEWWERRLTQAQKRYLRAMESLARIRRMALPALQVNIGGQQVNVAPGAAVATAATE